MSAIPILLALLAVAALAAGILVFVAFRRDLRAAGARLHGASAIAATAHGPIEYAEMGQGDPVLVVHGAGGGFDQGIEIQRSFACRGFRVIAASRFGYLRTPLPADASPAAQADAHASLLDALGIARAAVVGISAGAQSAMQFAIRHPDRCAALILLVPLAYKPHDVPASVPKLSPRARKVLMTIVGSDLLYWLALRLMRPLVIRLVIATPPDILRNASTDEQLRIERILTHVFPLRRRRDGLLNDAAIATSLTRFALEKIAAPTLVISVRDDLFGTYASARYTAGHIPRGKFVGYDDGGHLWVGHHAELVAELDAFLDRYGRRADNGPPPARPQS